MRSAKQFLRETLENHLQFLFTEKTTRNGERTLVHSGEQEELGRSRGGGPFSVGSLLSPGRTRGPSDHGRLGLLAHTDALPSSSPRWQRRVMASYGCLQMPVSGLVLLVDTVFTSPLLFLLLKFICIHFLLLRMCTYT